MLEKKYLMHGDGIGTLLITAFNMIKPALPKYCWFGRIINRYFTWN